MDPDAALADLHRDLVELRMRVIEGKAKQAEVRDTLGALIEAAGELLDWRQKGGF